MKRFLRDHGLWVLFAAAVIAVALAVGIALVLGIPLPQKRR